MKISNSKFILLTSVLLVLLLLATALLIFHSNREEKSHPIQTTASSLNQNSRPAVAEAKPIDQHGKSSPAIVTVQAKARFANEEQLCAGFVGKIDGKIDGMQFFNALQNRILGGGRSVEDWLRSIANNGTPRQKGAALSLLIGLSDKFIRGEALARQPNCDSEPNCSRQLEQMVASKVSPFFHALVNAAIYESDPVLYGMAHHVCHMFGLSKVSVCAQLNSIQWLHRDPDNGAAALYALGEMKLPKIGEDKTAFENALYRLSLAKKFDFYSDLGRELPPLPSALDDYAHRTELEAALWHFQLSLPFLPYQTILAACKGDALNNLNRRFVCEAITKQFLREDASLFDRATALKLARNLAWDQAQLQKMNDDLGAVSAYQKIQNEREEKNLQDQQGKMKACHQQLIQFANFKRGFVGEFKQYQREMNEFDISRDELIKIGRQMRARQ